MSNARAIEVLGVCFLEDLVGDFGPCEWLGKWLHAVDEARS